MKIIPPSCLSELSDALIQKALPFFVLVPARVESSPPNVGSALSANLDRLNVLALPKRGRSDGKCIVHIPPGGARFARRLVITAGDLDGDLVLFPSDAVLIDAPPDVAQDGLTLRVWFSPLTLQQAKGLVSLTFEASGVRAEFPSRFIAAAFLRALALAASEQRP